MSALSGTLMILLAQAGGICGADAVPTAAPSRPATIVQRDDGFVIAATDMGARPAAAAPVPLGRAVRIDPALLAAGGQQDGKTPR